VRFEVLIDGCEDDCLLGCVAETALKIARPPKCR
jgi:hypothetical protein